MSRQKDFQNSAERYADECGGTTQEKYKKLFDDAWKKHSIRVDIKPFPKYRNENGYYGYIYYRKKCDVNLSLWTREASTIDEVHDKCVESVQQLIKIMED